jgi:hypothetical protein
MSIPFAFLGQRRGHLRGLVLTGVTAAACGLALGVPAKAVTICDFGGYAGPNGPCASNQVLSFLDKRVTFSSLPSVGAGTVSLASIVQDVFTVQFIFFQPLKPSDPGYPGFGPLLPTVSNATTSYVIDIINNPGWIFSGVKIDSVDAGVLGTRVVKSELNNRFNPLTSLNGVPDPNTGDFALLNGAYNSLNVTDTYSVSGTGALTSFTNTYRESFERVPGPLPLAGALAGLAWTRRLRRRLQAMSA